MKKNTLFALWGGLFVLCAGLGFLPEPVGILKLLLAVLALSFFIPPAVLLRRAEKKKDRHCICLIRNLSAAWLVLTCCLLVVNFLSLMGSAALGDVVYAVLIVASAPMACGQVWILTMFCWACLLFTSIHLLKKIKTRT